MTPAARRTSRLVIASLAWFCGGCTSDDTAAIPSASAAASTPPAASASSVASASSQASADECQADTDCVLLSEDACCVPTTCDQDRQALTKARAEEKHLQCARYDCHEPARTNCSIADVRVVAACRQGRCVLFEPGVGGTGRIREPRPAQ